MANITVQFLREKFGDDISEAWEYLNTDGNGYSKYPFIPEKPHLSGSTATAFRKYADELEKYEEKMKEFKKEKQRIDNNNSLIDKTFQEYIREESGVTKLPEILQNRLWSKAYEDGHDDGYTSVYYHLCELVQLFNGLEIRVK